MIRHVLSMWGILTFKEDANLEHLKSLEVQLAKGKGA